MWYTELHCNLCLPIPPLLSPPFPAPSLFSPFPPPPLSSPFPPLPSPFSFPPPKWCEHVCHADRVPALHSGAIQHHCPPCQDAGQQDECYPRQTLTRCACVHARTCTGVCVCVCVCVCVYVCVYMCVCLCVYVCPYVVVWWRYCLWIRQQLSVHRRIL